MSNKDYSNWLIVSDIDGTLNNALRKTPKVNTQAIDDFVHNRKGNFTLASARGVRSLTPHYKNLPRVSTPAIVLNGAGIYDFTAEKMLWFNSVPKSAKSLIKEAMEKFPSLEIGVLTKDNIYLIRPRIMSPFMMLIDRLPHKRLGTIEEMPSSEWGKVIFFCYPYLKKKIKAFLISLACNDVAFIDTGAFSFDMVSSTTNKGTAVLRLAEILGVPEENIGAIGNYYNDLDMLKAVRHPACCKQSPEDIHAVCEYHACHCNKGAVADFIGYIYENY